MKQRRPNVVPFLALVAAAALAAGCASVGGGFGPSDGGGTNPPNDGGGSSDGGVRDGGSGGGMAGAACINVNDCARGYGCLSGRCTNAGTFECRNDLTPIVQVEPPTMDFGSVRVGDRVDRTLRIRNIGSCNLQILEVSLAPGTTSEFSCEECRPRGAFPVTLVPFDSKPFIVSYAATDAMADLGSLSVVTSDPTFPLITVPLKSTVKEAPKILIDPIVLEFGYVPLGQRKTLPFNITNVGGQTPLLVRSIENLPLASPNYTIATPGTAGFDGGLGYLNSSQTPGVPPVPMRVDITYAPTTLATHNEAIRVVSTDPISPRVDVQVKGFSVTPPNIRVTPTLVNFGAVGIGTRQQIPVTIENNGGADLQLTLAFAPLSSTAFRYNPSGLPAIPGGQRATLYMEYLPTELGNHQGILKIAHNAQGTPSPIEINLAGSGIATVGNDVLALEMTFENGDDNFFGSDLRDVDLHYESPFFHSCSKDQAAGAATVVCNWGNFGQPSWLGIGPKQEPERIVHTNPGAMSDGDFKVKLLYVQDCASLPTGLIVSLTGLALDVVLAYFGGGIVPGGAGSTIANAILNNCFDHSSTNAQIKVFINGQLSTSRTTRLGRQGDFIDVMTIHRENGRFTVR